MADLTSIEDLGIRAEDVLVLKDPEFRRENVCIVTGATSGIGQALAIVAAANGLSVLGVGLGVGTNEEAGQQTVEAVESRGGQMTFLRADLTRDEDIEATIDKAASMGAIKFLANVAGIQNISRIEDFPMERYDHMQRLMQRAPFYLSKLAIPHMRKSADSTGVIGNMGSVHAHVATLAKPVYCMVKFALRGLSQSISAEGGGKVRSFSVTTPYVKTPLAMNQIPDQARVRNITPDEVVRDVMLGQARVKEMMTPVEAANLFLFGFSRHARYLVGGDMNFDGGQILTY
ncbi:MAG: SDR family NAD(P)-dependent oxidoreductase [Pirellulales bacterium]|nr:SDR family NAD(P)-dependent oxidoreductase [Pirellulales bacterium]